VTLDVKKLLALDIPPKPFVFSERETMLYALGVGFAHDSLDDQELCFTFERRLKAVPTMAAVIGWDRSWIPRTGLDWTRVVHGEEHLEIFRTLPAAGEFAITSGVVGLIDKGKNKGAVLQIETTAFEGNERIFTRVSSFFARGDGGFETPSPIARPAATVASIPDRAPDAIVDSQTTSNSALIYRLSGDRNPLHCDPDVARAAGFERPILHGLCSYGHACRSVLKAFCNYDVNRISSFDVRFSAPVYPGETLRIAMWRENNAVLFEAFANDRNVQVLKNGHVGLR
jgi:acyl dehydratase